MKKITSLLLILWLSYWLFPQKTLALNNTWYYVVTAYYSPLPNQKSYLTGNYESEKRLNWQWIAWASWKWVFSWMLAWPRTYSFGTKIYIEWLWVWEIADRWGAIVLAWNRWYTHDRLDVWVWYWDEWLQRALYWWKRTVKWHIVDSNTKVSIDYKNMYAPEWATSWLQKQNTIFDVSLWKWSNPARVKELQEFFKDLWIYNWKIDWVYNDEITSIVYNYQINNQIVSSNYDAWAWYWWVKTRNSFKKAYLNWEFDEVTDSNPQEQSIIKGKGISEENTLAQPSSLKENVQENNLNIFDNAISGIENIKKLQEILIEMWLYSWELTWKYDDITGVIYDYQISNEIVMNKSTPWAWNFWPKTRASLKESYTLFLKEKEEKERLLQEQEKRKKELEKKYRELEKYAIEKATSRTNNLWVIREWEVSQNVRELQLILSDLGYFSEKDTAIFWPKTKEAVISFQLDFELIDSLDNQFAWVVGQRMVSYLNSELTNIYLKEKLEKTEIDLDELASVVDLEQLF